MKPSIPAQIDSIKRRIAKAKASRQATSCLEYQLQRLVAQQLRAEVRARRKAA